MDYDESMEKDIELIPKDFPVTKKKIYMNCGSFAPNATVYDKVNY